MINRILILFSIGILASCGEAVSKKTEAKQKENKGNALSKNVKYLDSLVKPNGLKIKWAFKGKGATIEKGDVILINYVVTLPNGKLVDGNSKITKSDLPFMVGYNMQTKGWDEAILAMNVGDVATMSARAIELLTDDAKLKTFKHNALEQAKLFDIHHIIPIYEQLYRRFCRTGDC